MEDPVADAILNQYFRRLEQALGGLPVERRTQIVEDLRAHVQECLEAEPEHSDAVVLAILGRLGDPDEIAREAFVDEGPPVDAVADRRSWFAAHRSLSAAVALLVVAVVALLVAQMNASSATTGPKPADPRASAGSGSVGSASVGYDGPAICSPTTDAARSGGSPASLEASGTQVASGTLEGQNWSLWSAKGQSGAAGLQDGGVVFGGREYGLCAGYPNPSETEMIDTGQSAVIYGVVNYPGLAKVQVSTGQINRLAVGTVLPSPHVQVVDGVSFYIGTLPQPACSYHYFEINTTSPSYSTEHNIGFGGDGAGQGYHITNDPGNDGPCVAGKLDPLSYSEGIWQLPPGRFNAGNGASRSGPGLPSGPGSSTGSSSASVGYDGPAICSPTTDAARSGGSPASLEANGTQVASGTLEGQNWSLWSAKGQSGAAGLQDGGVVFGGREYGLCAGYPNPSETEMIDTGQSAVIYGVVNYPGLAKVQVSTGQINRLAVGTVLPSPHVQVVDGVSFYIGTLPQPACSYHYFEINTTSPSYSTEHNIGFGGDGAGQGYHITNDPGNDGPCVAGKLDPLSYSEGIWQLPPGQFNAGNGGAGRPPTPTLSNGWLPASDVTGGGGVDTSNCSPQTVSGSESASALEAGATQVASGTTDGHSWSLWSKNGQSGATGLEEGGVVIDGVAHGLCPGFPNPAEMELLEPSGGGDGIAYGAIGYPGTTKVAVYDGTVETFDTGKLLALTTAQSVNGVGFFITALSSSVCGVSSVELNTASQQYAAEHNLGFSDKGCADGQLVPINWSQGVWQLPPRDFPNKFQSVNRGETPGQLSRTGLPGRLLSRTGPDFSSCSPPTDAATSGEATNTITDASQVASGTTDGHGWSLWSKHGEHGSAALEDAGVILDGHAYGICPGVPNPAEFELIDPSSGGNGVVIGVSGYDGSANVKLSVGTPGSFAAGTLLYSGHTVATDGTGFFIAQLPKSACDYSWLELSVKASHGSSQHLLGFGPCSTGKLATITGGQGAWSASP